MIRYLIIAFLVAYLLYVVQIIPRCIGFAMMLHRTEKGSWRAFVPFRSSYVGFRLAGRRAWFVVDLILWQITWILPILYLLISPVTIAVSAMLTGSGASEELYGFLLFLFLPFVVLSLFRFFIHGMRSIGICERFGLPTWLRLGMVFLPGVFYLLVGSSFIFEPPVSEDA